jgi:hypothetical protein
VTVAEVLPDGPVDDVDHAMKAANRANTSRHAPIN